SSSTSTTSSATASTSPHGSKLWPSRVGSASAAWCATGSVTSSTSPSTTGGSRRSRTSPVPSAYSMSGSTEKQPRLRRIHRQGRRWHCPTVEGPSTPVPDDLLRLSVGIEDPQDLIADLESAL